MGLKGSLRNVSTGVIAIPDSAIAHWPHSEGSGSTVEDVVGGFDADITGASWVSNSWQDGFALEYDSDDYTNAGNSSELTGFDQMTVAFTLDLNSPPDSVSIPIGKTTAGGTGGSDSEYIFQISDSFYFWQITTDTDRYRLDLPEFSTDRQRVVGWYNGDEMRVYINGDEIDSRSASGTIEDQGRNLTFGGNTDGDRVIDGVIDNVILADEAWSDKEIEDDYNNQPWS